MSRRWLKLGADISGAAGDYSGYSIAMSEDGNRMVVGAIYTDDEGAMDSGLVQVYQLIAGTWEPMGPPIRGEVSGDYAGFSVAISKDGSRVAVSAPFSDAYGTNSGLVRVYDANSGWAQVGPDISGENAGDQAGFSIAMNGAGDRIAVGAIRLIEETESVVGHVRIFDLGEGEWTQVGNTIVGEAAPDYAGFSVAMNEAGDRVVVGATSNSGTGHARVYDLINNMEWAQQMEFSGIEMAQFGYSVSLDASGNRLAVGAPRADTKGQVTTYVRGLDGVWSADLMPLVGVADEDMYGQSVKLSADGLRLIVGAPGSDVSGDDDKGRVYVYERSGSGWALMSSPWTGISIGDNEGYSLAIAGDRLAFGSIKANSEGGRTRAYRLLSNIADISSATFGSVVRSGDSWAQIDVSANVSSITPTIVMKDSLAQFTPTGALTLADSSNNVFKFTGIAEDGAKKEYTITIRRLSGNTDISGVDVSGGITINGQPVLLGFGGENAPSVLVRSGITQVEGAAFIPELEYPDLQLFDVSYNYDLKLGDNEAKFIVTAEDRSVTQEYPFIIRVASADTDISANFVIGNTPTSITFDGSSASIVVYGDFEINVAAKDANAGISGEKIITELPDGSSSFIYVVTAEDSNISASYTLNVYKKSNDTSIASIVLNGTTYPSESLFFLNGKDQKQSFYVQADTVDANISVESTQANATVSFISSLTLSNGANRVTGTVSAEYENVTKMYTLLVTVLSEDVRLQSVTVNDTLYYDYTIAGQKIVLPAGTTSVVVSGIAVIESSTVSVSGDSDLSEGDNIVTISVYNGDMTYNAEYSFNAYVPSGDKGLLGLTVDSISYLELARNEGTIEVGYDVENPVFVVSKNPKATHTISGHTALVVGENTVTINVVAEDTTSKSYTFTIYRKSNNTDLSGFVVDIRQVKTYFNINGFTIDSIAVARYANISASPVHSGATISSISPSGSIDTSGNVIITVKAEDRSKSKVYTLPIEILSADTSLQSVLVDGSGLNVAAVAARTATYTVRYDISSVGVDVNAVTGARDENISGHTELQVGDNDVSFNVIAANNYDARPYTFNVHRMSNDATLQRIDVSGSFGLVIFDLSKSEFTLQNPVKYATQSLYLTPIKHHPGAVVAPSDVSLALGWNSFIITVKAEDDTYSQDYTFRVYRQNNVATLSSLRVTDGAGVLTSTNNPAVITDISGFTGQIVDVSGTLTDTNSSLVLSKPSVTGSGDYTVVVVTSEDGLVTTTYKIRLSNIVSNDKSLTSVTITDISLNIADLSNGTLATVLLPYRYFDVSAADIVTAIGNSTASSVDISGARLSTTSQPITITVTAQDRTVKNYTFQARVKSNNASISAVTLNESSILNGSSINNQIVGSAIATATIAVTHVGVSVSGAGTIALNYKANSVTIIVTAEDGNTTSKTFEIYRRSNNTDISSLRVNNNTFTLAGSTFTGPNLARLAGANPIDISYTLGDSAASLSIAPYTLVDGSNNVNLTVTAEDNTVSRPYSLRFYMKSDKKALTSLTVGGVTKPYAGSGTQFDLPFGTQAVPLAGAHTGVSIGFSSYTLAAETTATASATVTAEDGTTAQYPFKLYVKSGNANLTANPTWLGTSPTTVGYDVSSILVTATPVFSRATVTYNGSANPRVPLVVGDNSVTVVVTAEDTAISRTYGPYQIRRQSDNTNLAAVFVASKVEYTWTGNAYTGTAIRVGHLDFNIVPLETAAIAEIVELVTVEPPTYAIVNPATYVAGQTYNKFIRVSAEDRTKIEYYPITFRTLSNNVALTSVAINGVVPFPPIVVPYATASIPVSASAANGATVVISGIVDGRVPLVVGDNTIVITVTAEDHVMTHAYSYTVRRRSNVADISGLIIGGTPVDNLAAVRGGTAIVTVSSITSSVAVQATPSHPRASVTNINGHLSLFPGDNDVRFTIRAEDGNVIEYYITVRRAATNTKLAEVTINNVPISVSAIRTGTAYIKTKRSVNVFVETQDPNALATYVLSNPLVDGSGNQLHITVKAEDRDISANYTVKVDILSNITSLSSFVINGTPVSHGGRFQVGPRVTSVKVVATAAHSAATLAIAGHEQLRPGLNTVTVTATAEDGTIQEHKVTVQVGPTTPEPVGQGPTAPLTYTDDQDRVDRLAGSYILSTYRRWNRVADYDTYLRMKRFLNR